MDGQHWERILADTLPQAAVLFVLTFLIFTLVFSLADPLSDEGGCAHKKRDARLERLRKINDPAHNGESLPLALLCGDCSGWRVSFDSDSLSGRVIRNGEGCVGRWQTVAAPTASWGEDAPHLAMGRVPCDLHQL